MTVSATTASAATWASQLLRYPWLTDMTSSSVVVMWASSVSSSGSVQYGSSPSCSGKTVTAARNTITVGSKTEYQWKATMSGLSAGASYCYRVYNGSPAVDLLGSDPSPTFIALPKSGSTTSFSFAVVGDFGDTTTNGLDPGDTSNGVNPDQAKVMAQIASSGARFAVTVGDIAYPSGTQANYGDLNQTGKDVSAVFGPTFWKSPGSHIPLFVTVGNHGLTSTLLNNWSESHVASASSGVYGMVSYPSIDGSTAASYPTTYYAIQAGNARIYMLDAAWSDANHGSVSQYQIEHDAHWTTSAAEYKWLVADLQAHPGGVKFAVFHYPLHADNATEGTDSYLDGSQSLEGLLATNGVGIAFTGHAHIYERNLPQVGRLVSYVIGSSGAKIEPVSACQSYDAYAVGWSYTSNHGSACGGAPVPASPASVFHFALVTVSGTSVTVAPTDENGNTFDVQHYNFATDTQSPTAPTNLTATATGATAVSLGWGASSDNIGVAGYRIYRDVGTSTPATLLTTVGSTATSYTDTTASPSTTYTYAVKAFDGSGNVSAASNNATVTTPASGAALFSDGFESGDLSKWTSSVATSVTTSNAFSGTYAAECVSTGSGPAYAYKSLGSGYTDLYLKAEVRIASRGANSVYLLKARKSTSASIVGVYVNSSGKLALRNDAGSVTLTSSIVVSTGTWHSVELHLSVGSSGSTQVWYDGTLVSALSQTQNTGTTAAGQLQIGDSTSSGRSFDVLVDDVVADTSFIAV